MNMILAALALAVQAPSPPTESGPLSSEFPPARELTPGHDLFFEDFGRPTPAARAAAQAFGECVADRSPELAARTLAMDFRSRTYGNSLRHVSRANESCFQAGRQMRSGGLLVAGGMAERLLERDPSPVNVQLARAASQPAPAARTPAEAVAICVVRSTPDDVGRLLATEVASDAEVDALRTIAPVVGLCNQSGGVLQITHAGIRAILATAAFRIVQTNAALRNVRSADQAQ